ncbi:structural maintenance of chromosomes protein 1B-like [Schistocerca piceifrons]|uniref:structural maintenance of chromosomes protein 1B-like n=1 Tax=Schistocerca piceifrons TaxID=274613 RepID=UPI001F5E7A24|nr:structural maintenance of chromosomes protein 1B-like [Schistocerca piceifrons]
MLVTTEREVLEENETEGDQPWQNVSQDERPVPIPTVEEVRKAIKSLRNNKAPGSNNISAEMIESGGKHLTRLMKNIDLPFVRGSLADVSLTSSSSDTSAERTVLRSDEIEVDFSDLTEEDKSLSAEDFDSLIVTMESEIQDLESNSLDSPDIAQVTERVNMWEDKMKEINFKLKRETAKTNNLRNNFENIKRRRLEAFMACFKHVSSMISNIYKDLMQSNLCHVMLTLENEEEPYLGGVQVCFVEHGKPCIGMASLSGGEAVMAGLALTFALHSFLQSPLLIFDEVDDALDANNIDRLVRYVNSHKDSMQITVITLNKKIAAECDVIVGVCPNQKLSGVIG